MGYVNRPEPAHFVHQKMEEPEGQIGDQEDKEYAEQAMDGLILESELINPVVKEADENSNGDAVDDFIVETHGHIGEGFF